MNTRASGFAAGRRWCDRPAEHWFGGSTAAPSMLVAVENEGITRRDLGRPYFARAAALDPCDGCATLVSRFSSRTDLFQPGSKLALNGGTTDRDAPTPPAARPGWWSRLRSR